MTYDQVAELYRRNEKASIWPSANPERFYFWVSGRGTERVAYLYRDDGNARYLWLPIDEVRDHVEPTVEADSQNVYYRLRSRDRR
jgi:hypothetical protein